MLAVIISTDLNKYLEEKNIIKARVHSIFESSFNIMDDDGVLIGIIASDRDIAPMSVLVERDEIIQSNIRIEEKVVIKNKRIIFVRSNTAINLNGVKKWNPQIKMIKDLNSTDQTNDFLEYIKSILIDKESNLGLAELIKFIVIEKDSIHLKSTSGLSYYSAFIYDRLLLFLNAVLKKEYKRAIDLVDTIIGFGQGLTPSIDDIIVGIMISLKYASLIYEDYEEVDEFNTNIYIKSLGKTTKISEEMLRHASIGHISRYHQRAVESIFYKNHYNKEELYRRVISHGSSSGADFLFGVYITCKIILLEERGKRN